MKKVKLTMALGRMVQSDETEGEDDGLAEIHEAHQPVVIDAAQVRNYYPRREPRIGTRILFLNGSAIPVLESMEVVEQRIDAALAS